MRLQLVFTADAERNGGITNDGNTGILAVKQRVVYFIMH